MEAILRRPGRLKYGILRRIVLPAALVPDSLSGGGTIVHMHHRLIAILAIFCFTFGAAGCESLYRASLPKPKSPKKKKEQRERKQYEAVIMPLQTGSTLQRRAFIEVEPDSDKPKKKSKKKEPPSPKPEAESSETPSPAPEETPAPTPERFR
jgi:hypothetical protein